MTTLQGQLLCFFCSFSCLTLLLFSLMRWHPGKLKPSKFSAGGVMNPLGYKTACYEWSTLFDCKLEARNCLIHLLSLLCFVPSTQSALLKNQCICKVTRHIARVPPQLALWSAFLNGVSRRTEVSRLSECLKTYRNLLVIFK